MKKINNLKFTVPFLIALFICNLVVCLNCGIESHLAKKQVNSSIVNETAINTEGDLSHLILYGIDPEPWG